MAKWWDVTPQIRLQEDCGFWLANPTLRSYHTTSSTFPPTPLCSGDRGEWAATSWGARWRDPSDRKQTLQPMASEDLRPVNRHMSGLLPDPGGAGGWVVLKWLKPVTVSGLDYGRTPAPINCEVISVYCLKKRGLGVICYTSIDHEYNPVSFLLLNYKLLENIRLSSTTLVECVIY